MNRAGKFAALILVIPFVSGCTVVESLMDRLREPEEIVLDYLDHVSGLVRSDEPCESLSVKLSEYYGRREEAVTEAVKGMAVRQLDGQIPEDYYGRLDRTFRGISGYNIGRCVLTPSVLVEQVKCMSPMKAFWT